MGSLNVDSKISLRTCRVRGSRRLKSGHSEKYLTQSQRHVPAPIAALVDVALFPCASAYAAMNLQTPRKRTFFMPCAR